MIKGIQKNIFLFIPLILSLVYFIRKGIQYALMERFGPLVFVGIFIVLFLLSIKTRRKMFAVVSRIWAVIIIVWSIARIFIAIINYFTNTFDEYHLNNQFGNGGMIVSIIMLLLGIMIFKYAHKKRMKLDL